MKREIQVKNLFSSDVLLYNLLEETHKSNPILKDYIISFPSQTRLINENYGIFIGHGINTLVKSTSNSDMYENKVRVVIKTREKDPKLAKIGLDAATREIIGTIKDSDLNNRQFRWVESRTAYHTSTHAIKYRTLDLVFAEQYSWENTRYDKRDIELLFGDPVIDDSDISPEEARENEIYELIDRIKELKAEGVDLFPYILKDTF